MIQQDTRGNAKKARTRQQLLKPECYGSRTNEHRLVLKRLSVAGFKVLGDTGNRDRCARTSGRNPGPGGRSSIARQSDGTIRCGCRAAEKGAIAVPSSRRAN